MNLHEYQAKQLLNNFGLPVPKGEVAYTAEDAVKVASRLSTKSWVVKAQIHAGGRGKAGGVKVVLSHEELAKVSQSLLGKNLVTYQTDAKGQPVNCLLIEETCDIASELYLGAVLDRVTQRVVIMASVEGGVEIETVAEKTPEKILKVVVDPLVGVMPFQARQVAFKLNLNENQIK